MRLRDVAQLVDLFVPRFDPAGGPKSPMIARCKLMTGLHVIMEKPAIIHHPGDDFHSRFLRRGKGEMARPRLERIEDDHRPVDQALESLETKNQVERETIGRPGGHAELSR